jgi:hypothetical protein
MRMGQQLGQFVVIILTTTAGLPQTAEAQSFIEKLVDRVEFVSVDGIATGDFLDDDLVAGRGFRGIRFEVGLTLGDEEEVAKRSHSLYLALAYSQITGFHFADSGAVISGGIETFPEIALYLEDYVFRSVAAYAGARAGLTRLHHFQVLNPVNNSAYVANSTTFTFGADMGVTWYLPIYISPFVEVSAAYRQFPSLEWKVNGGTAIPVTFPQSLRASTWAIRFGVTVDLNPPKK